MNQDHDTQNRLIDAALQAARSTLVRLNELHIQVQNISIGDLPHRKPRLSVSPPPASVQLARGLIRQNKYYQTWASCVGECQVEWTCPR